MPLTHVYHTPQQEPQSSVEYLSDLSEKDRTWDEHRAFADRLTEALNRAGLPQYSSRVAACAHALFYQQQIDLTTGEILLKLHSSTFCHFRHCPICQWRRSLRNKAIFLNTIPSIEEAYPSARWLMLTLTVRNCAIEDLRNTVQSMNKAWTRLLKRPEFSHVLGWVRSVEVTRSKDGTAHPHYHCLLMVPPSYFSGAYFVRTERWAEVWGQCMRVDYTPIVDARSVRPKVVKAEDGSLVQSKSALQAAAAEVLKYATKGEDLLDGGPEWLAEFIAQVHGLKFLTSGGVLKGIFRRSEAAESDDDLVHVDGEQDENTVDGKVLRFDWHKPVKRYRRKRKG